MLVFLVCYFRLVIYQSDYAFTILTAYTQKNGGKNKLFFGKIYNN